MATLPMFSYSPFSHLLIFSLLTLTWKPIFSFSLQTVPNNPKFDSDIALFGDADFTDVGSSVQLTRPLPSSYGLLIYSKPFKFLEPNPTKPTSFSVEFTFSISPQNGDGLALIVVPTDFPSKFSRKTTFGLSRENRFLGIQFDTSMNENHLRIDVGSLVASRVCNVSSLDLVLNSGLKLQSWVDYEASSKRLEIRLSKFGDTRPYNPLLTYPIDLSEMWKEEEVYIGLSSSSGNSSQISTVYSWKFGVRTVPNSMHSQPLDPQKYSDQHGDQKTVHNKRFLPLAILSNVLFFAAFGGLVSFLVLFVWRIFNGGKIIQTERSSGLTDFRYEKVDVVVEKNLEGVKK